MMKGKVCIITGATDGLGFEAARRLVQRQAKVVLIGRQAEKLAHVQQELNAQTEHADIAVYTADLSSLAQIKGLAEQIRNTFRQIDVLINNVGSVSTHFTRTEDGLEKTIATNHFSYFLLTNLLLEPLLQAEQARIINVASQSHLQGRIDFKSFTADRQYNLFKAYSQSKLANLLFTYTLAERLKGTGITVNAISPGRVRTQIGNKNQPWYVSWVWSLLMRLNSVSVAEAAAIYEYLAISKKVAHVTGQYFNRYGKIIPSSVQSYDKTLAQQLWQESELLIGQSFSVPLQIQS